LVILWLISVASSQDVFCEAKSWASIVAADTAPVVKQTDDAQVETTKQSTHIQTKGRILPPGVYGSLPKGAEQYTVHHVYDGDTLTLTNEKRVRLLGIDTPELAERQAFSKEAKEYTKDYCHKSQVYLTFPSDEEEDKYGRWLALVWVKVNEGFLCVNEGLVFEGLATVYLAKKVSESPNLKKMLVLQRQARTARRGIWSKFQDFKVVATRFGSAYHKPTCGHLSRSRNLRTLQASEAADEGLHPCRTCLADM